LNIVYEVLEFRGSTTTVTGSMLPKLQKKVSPDFRSTAQSIIKGAINKMVEHPDFGSGMRLMNEADVFSPAPFKVAVVADFAYNGGEWTVNAFIGLPSEARSLMGFTTTQ